MKEQYTPPDAQSNFGKKPERPRFLVNSGHGASDSHWPEPWPLDWQIADLEERIDQIERGDATQQILRAAWESRSTQDEINSQIAALMTERKRLDLRCGRLLQRIGRCRQRVCPRVQTRATPRARRPASHSSSTTSSPSGGDPEPEPPSSADFDAAVDAILGPGARSARIRAYHRQGISLDSIDPDLFQDDSDSQLDWPAGQRLAGLPPLPGLLGGMVAALVADPALDIEGLARALRCTPRRVRQVLNNPTAIRAQMEVAQMQLLLQVETPAVPPRARHRNRPRARLVLAAPAQMSFLFSREAT